MIEKGHSISGSTAYLLRAASILVSEAILFYIHRPKIFEDHLSISKSVTASKDYHVMRPHAFDLFVNEYVR